MTSTSTDRRFGVNSSMAIKVPCLAATTAVITLSGEQTVDGVACVTSDRVLVKDQASGVDNGIYSVDTGSWERTPDFDGLYDAVQGTMVEVVSGSTNGNRVFALTTADPIIGTSALSFSAILVIGTFPISIANGGTGSTTASDARTALDARGNTDDVTLAAGKVIVFEGTTDNAFETTLTVADPTADNTATLPNKSGTIAMTSDIVGGVQIQPISASVGSNALTISASALSLEFRSNTLGSGTVTTVTGTPSNLVISSGSTLGTFSAIQSRIAVIAMNNAGTIELAAVNAFGGTDISEAGIISTTAEGGAGAANSATVIYSTTARSNLAYRVIGYIESTQATAGTWVTAPSTLQGAGGQALVPRGLIMTGGAAIPTSSGSSISVTGFPVGVKRISINFNGTSTNGSSIIMVQIGDAGGIENSGYTAGGQNNGGSYQAQTTGFGITSSTASTDTLWGTVVLSLVDPSANTWAEFGVISKGATAAITVMSAGVKSLSATLDRILLTTVSGGDTFDAGSMSVFYEM